MAQPSTVVNIRISPKLKAAGEKAARAAGKEFGPWVRGLIAQAAGLEEETAELKQGLAALSKKRRKEIATQGGTAKGESKAE